MSLNVNAKQEILVPQGTKIIIIIMMVILLSAISLWRNREKSMLNCLSWPTLEERRRQFCLAVTYRILHNQVDIHWQSFLTKTSSCTRGHSCRLFVPFCKNHVYASSFFLALVKTGITLPLIQLMHHPLTSLPGS